MTLMNIFAHIDNISYKSIRSKLRGIWPGEIQITSGGKCWSNTNGLISHPHMKAFLIRIGIQRNCFDSQLLTGPNNPYRDFPTIRYQ